MTRNNNRRTENSNDPNVDVGTRWRQVAQRHYDPDENVELTTAIVFAIAEAEGVSPTEVKSPSLYESVDVAAIEDTFFGPDFGEVPQQGTGTIEFHYRQYLVKVKSDGWIQVCESNETDLQ
jgi:hypothetical protein